MDVSTEREKPVEALLLGAPPVADDLAVPPAQLDDVEHRVLCAVLLVDDLHHTNRRNSLPLGSGRRAGDEDDGSAVVQIPDERQAEAVEDVSLWAPLENRRSADGVIPVGRSSVPLLSAYKVQVGYGKVVASDDSLRAPGSDAAEQSGSLAYFSLRCLNSRPALQDGKESLAWICEWLPEPDCRVGAILDAVAGVVVVVGAVGRRPGGCAEPAGWANGN